MCLEPLHNPKKIPGVIILLLALLSLNSCKSVKQIYYTEEGTPYRLVVATRTLDQVFAPGGVNPRLIINSIPVVDVNTSIDAIYVKTDKPIVPLIMNYTLQRVTVGPVYPPEVELSVPYYNVILGGIQQQNHLPGLSKCLANIEALVVDDTTNDKIRNRFGIKYNQIVLTDKDFITSNINNVFQFKTNLCDIYSSGISPIFTYNPGGRAIVVQTVLYFELQKNP